MTTGLHDFLLLLQKNLWMQISKLIPVYELLFYIHYGKILSAIRSLYGSFWEALF